MSGRFICCWVVLSTFLSSSRGQDVGSKYGTYWLKPAAPRTEKAESQYLPLLLLTRAHLHDLPKLTANNQSTPETETLRKQGRPVPILESVALVIETYQRDSIWNATGDPVRPVGKVTDFKKRERTLVLDGQNYHTTIAHLPDVIRLLKNPEGKEPLHRIHGPINGMEQTVFALRSMLEAQYQLAIEQNATNLLPLLNKQALIEPIEKLLEQGKVRTAKDADLAALRYLVNGPGLSAVHSLKVRGLFMIRRPVVGFCDKDALVWEVHLKGWGHDLHNILHVNAKTGKVRTLLDRKLDENDPKQTLRLQNVTR